VAEILQFFIIGFVVVFAVYAVYVSSMIIDQRNRLRKYTGEYYDVDIHAALKKRNKTVEQALDEHQDKES
jgi:hypothetical protein